MHSRSATCVAAYLMMKHGMSATKVLIVISISFFVSTTKVLTVFSFSATHPPHKLSDDQGLTCTSCIPDICHGRHGHTRVNFFWPV